MFFGRCQFRFYFSIILKVDVGFGTVLIEYSIRTVGFGFLKYHDIAVDFFSLLLIHNSNASIYGGTEGSPPRTHSTL